MRVVLFIFIALIVGCRKDITENSSEIQVSTDTTSVKLFPGLVQDTVIKISEPFILNKITSYWRHKITESEISIELRNYKTDKILLEDSFYIYSPIDYKAADYFERLSQDGFRDVNFDGFTDIVYRIYGSTTLSDEDNIYLFNNVDKSYKISPDLSDNHIKLIDTENRRLITGSEYKHGADSTIHYFDRSGNIKLAEVYSDYRVLHDTTWIDYKSYKKIVNKEIVIERTSGDTIKWQ